MKIRFLAAVLVVAVAATLAVALNSPAKPAASAGTGFEIVPLNPEVKAALKAQGKSLSDLIPAGLNQGKKFNPSGGLVGQFDTAAEQNVLVLFVEFSDAPPGAPAERLDMSYFDDLLFGTVYDPPEYDAYPDAPTDRTLVHFFDELSFGKIDIATLNMPSDMGWMQVGKPYSYYCTADGVHDNGFGPYPNNVQGLVYDALKLADPMVDFRNYAVDGKIPNLFVVIAGTGAEWSADPSIIWSHSGDLVESGGPGPYIADGVEINEYAMMPELGGDLTGYAGVVEPPYPPTVGVFAHEYGHVLGLPDQYDYGYESEGTGRFSLMAGGDWNRYPSDFIFYGNSPAQPDAWSKYRLGLVNPIEITGTTNVVIPPAETDPVAYKMVVPGSGGSEYFLFENRQNVGFDKGLMYRTYAADGSVASATPIHGLAVYHVDDGIFTLDYWRPNEAENWKEWRSAGWREAENGASHYAISLLQADDRWDLEHGNNAGDPGDLYPGSRNVTKLGNFTYPNTSSYYFWMGSLPKFGYSGVTVTNIKEVNGTITCTLSYQSVTGKKSR
jgi:immune inhibitor A